MISNTINTTINSVSNTNNEIKNSFVKCLTDFQLDNTHIGINNVVNNINNKDIPSIPIVKVVPLNGIQFNVFTI